VKQLIILITLVGFVSILQAEALGFYMDFGGGVGMASNDLFYSREYTYNFTQGGTEYKKEKGFQAYPSDFAFQASTKMGYSPFSFPLYLVADVDYLKTTLYDSDYIFDDSSSYQHINSSTQLQQIFAGPGIVFFPASDFQMATSVGVVFTNLYMKYTEKFTKSTESQANIPEPIDYTISLNGIGYGFNASASMDLGSMFYTAGLMVGVKFQYAKAGAIKEIKLETAYSDADYDFSSKEIYSPSTTYVGIFLKYRSRE